MEKTRKNILNKALIVGTALVSISSVAVQKAQAAAGTGPMTAVILEPIVVSGTQALHFGSITQTGVGTVTIDTAGNRSSTGSVTEVVGLGAEQQGVLSLSGATGVNIVLSMAAATFTVDDAGLGVAMNVNGFNIETAAGGATQTVTITVSPGAIPLGGTLNVGATQVAGTYTGTYTINANYQ